MVTATVVAEVDPVVVGYTGFGDMLRSVWPGASVGVGFSEGVVGEPFFDVSD